jgi:acyl-CoA thioesterase-1
MSGNHSGDHRICFIGDSLVQGTGDPECLGWVGRVSAKALVSGWNVTAYNLGIRGDTSRDIVARWKNEAVRRFPADTEHYVVFSFGVNDTMFVEGARRISLCKSRESFLKIFELASSQYSTVMIGPPPVSDSDHNSRIEELCHLFEELAQQLDIPYLLVYEKLRQDTIWMEEVNEDDGAHPRAGGYQQLANLVAQWPSWWFKSVKA